MTEKTDTEQLKKLSERARKLADDCMPPSIANAERMPGEMMGVQIGLFSRLGRFARDIEVMLRSGDLVPRSASVPGWRDDEICEKLGSWLSAALEDDNVCDEFKADIRAWFDAGEPAGHSGLVNSPTRERELEEAGPCELPQLREIAKCARRLLEGASGHYINAEDRWCLETALDLYEGISHETIPDRKALGGSDDA
ncbi:hypothetical protein [Henriciella aquimarina]|uniref:hypothetical protein n=1 Tax=Henriciella aquimarina TaxID=545261 RepID=UPI0009FE1EFE|nr:hypothetical protein [Henriciella aquimarina]